MPGGDRPCRSETLARGPAAHVQRCADCGCVSIHMGPTTVRVDPAVLRSLVSTLAEALVRIDQAATEPGTMVWSQAPGKA